MVNIITELQEFGAYVDCFDPWVDPLEADCEYGIKPVSVPEKNSYDAIVLAVGHKDFIDMGAQTIRLYGKESHVLYDLKYLFPSTQTDLRL